MVFNFFQLVHFRFTEIAKNLGFSSFDPVVILIWLWFSYLVNLVRTGVRFFLIYYWYCVPIENILYQSDLVSNHFDKYE